MTFNTYVALACVVWLLSCGASLLALYWNIKAPQRPRAAFILSCAALVFAYGGLSRIQLHASKTVNGHLMWSINSRWFFVGALVLGAASLAWSLWNWTKAKSGSAALAGTIVFFLAGATGWAGDFGNLILDRWKNPNPSCLYAVEKWHSSRVPHGSHGLPHGLLEKRPNVYAGPHGFTGFYPQGGGGWKDELQECLSSFGLARIGADRRG